MVCPLPIACLMSIPSPKGELLPPSQQKLLIGYDSLSFHRPCPAGLMRIIAAMYICIYACLCRIITVRPFSINNVWEHK